VSDLVMDYGLLNQAAQDIQGLSPEINRVKNVAHMVGRGEVSYNVPGQTNSDNVDLGPTGSLFTAMGRFYGSWSSDMSNAMDGLDKLAGYFKGVADSFMETDASQAAGFNESAMMSAVLRYPAQVDEYYQILANAQKAGKPLPTPPTPPQDAFTLPGTSGLTTTFTYGGDDPDVPAADQSTHAPNQLISSETTTVTVDGMTYTETTTFGADQGWGPDGPTQDTTQVITNPDGTTDTLKTTIDPSGAGTMTDTDGNGNTNTYTRSDWNAQWVDTTPKNTGSGGDSNSQNNSMTTWDGGA
jgi:hypothetical protein